MSVVTDVFTELIDEANLGVRGTDLFSDFEPAAPDALISVWQLPTPGQKAHGFGDQPPSPVDARVQFIVRSAPRASAAGWGRAYEVWRLVAGASNKILPSGAVIQASMADSLPTILDRDAEDRVRWSWTCDATVKLP